MDKPKCWFKNAIQLKVEVGLKFEITFLTQHLGLSIFDPNLGSNNVWDLVKMALEIMST